MAVTYSQNGVIVRQNTVKQVAYMPQQSNSLIIDKNGYIGDIQPSSSNTYFAYMVNDADYSNAHMGQVSIIEPQLSHATIKDKVYTTVTIGNQTWMAENLDMSWDELPIGESSDNYQQRANYYDDNETTYGWSGKKYGLLYNAVAVRHLQSNKDILCPGWHVPTFDELNTLLNNALPSSFDTEIECRYSIAIKSSTEWNGNNALKFGLIPSGYRLNDGRYYSADINCNLYTSTMSNASNYQCWITTANMIGKARGNQPGDQFSIRLIKDSA